MAVMYSTLVQNITLQGSLQKHLYSTSKSESKPGSDYKSSLAHAGLKTVAGGGGSVDQTEKSHLQKAQSFQLPTLLLHVVQGMSNSTYMVTLSPYPVICAGYI